MNKRLQHQDSEHIQSNNQPPNVELYIGELILHGFPSVDPSQLSSIVQHELTQLITEQGTPSSLGAEVEITSLQGNEFRMEPGSSIQTIGSQIAHAVYGELNR